ncbi:hypothetical protein BZG02_12000 [Labilibaculum filiforme]|uniref:Uncharacterized protein n=2 Tax=Labilibaculum filiforme TaxID=1940526 RepID=A0A2N3HWM0_9BACT|nr:hypothetical protein BZG02_12000 [Labilibaculum filiforme]
MESSAIGRFDMQELRGFYNGEVNFWDRIYVGLKKEFFSKNIAIVPAWMIGVVIWLMLLLTGFGKF